MNSQPTNNICKSNESLCPLLFIKSYLFTLFPFVYGYLICYFEFSFTWIALFATLLAVIRTDKRTHLVGSFLHEYLSAKFDNKNETSSTSGQHIQNILKWFVTSSTTNAMNVANGMEQALWLNKALAQAWPYITPYLKEELRDKVLQKLADQYDVRLVEIDLGNVPPIVQDIKCYDPDQTTKDKIVFDLDILYQSNCENVQIEKFGFVAGVKNCSLSGLLRVELDQMSTFPVPPFAGSISMSFYQDPQLDYEFTDCAFILRILNILDIDTVRNLILQAVRNFIVDPHKFVIWLHSSQQQSPLNSVNSIDSDYSMLDSS